MKKKQYIPLGENVLVLSETEEDSGSVLIMPKANDDNSTRKGRVLCVGADAKFTKEDDVVIFKKWGGSEVFLEEYNDTSRDQKCFVVKESDILVKEGGK
ncbi:MAG: chaperonin 10 Kd subunit [Candidatus Xenolissoclinum pacificiensis L6]|uniref:10 kDa chaperonin n=1 Tax=Candidatus Xenolissoclinum pacificiensis L6 TaxID=1401685 RepID=W2V0A4_9RICK|nr:MAG: chaperonin 10 Kd subunit [Candidatus Xenolissoclinum pacificiensis L6]